jgi:DNA-binding HxlR family transcriptional regulator
LGQAEDVTSHEASNDAAVLALFDVLGRRWTLRIIWALHGEAMTYRPLAAAIPAMSTAMLTQRLRDLRAAGLVEHEHGAGYRLTPLGRDLLAHLTPLGEWAERVAFGSETPPR